MKIAIERMLLEPLRSVPANSEAHYNVFDKNVPWDNIGNYFISQALTDIIDFEEAIVISAASSDEAIKYVNNNCEVFIIRGATMLGRDKISNNLPYEFIKKIKIPIVWIGYGIENPLGVKSGDLSKEDINVLRYIHDNTVSTMVRGETSANILYDIGIKNIRILGCPTFYWSLKPENPIKKPKWNNVYWTWREHLYSPGKEELLKKRQFDAVESAMARSGSLKVALQDMGEEWLVKNYYLAKSGYRNVFMSQEPWPPRLVSEKIEADEIRNKIISKYIKFANAKTIDWLMNNTFFSFNLEEYRNHLTNADFILGCRLHGNMMGLSHGVPAYFYVYDERLKEIVDLLEVPYGTLMDKTLIPDIENLDFSKYERKYKLLYKEFYQFLEENKIKNRLEKPI